MERHGVVVGFFKKIKKERVGMMRQCVVLKLDFAISDNKRQEESVKRKIRKCIT